MHSLDGSAIEYAIDSSAACVRSCEALQNENQNTSLRDNWLFYAWLYNV